ncbi:MAG: immunity 30 family protein [Pelosinus sp.]|nr:immunity 30 family protein [Pelosinus sp.]
MDLKAEVQRLKQNRLLRNRNEVQEFEEAIENIVSLKDVKLINDLCSGFDDQTEEHEVMFGLIHAIEDFEGEEGLREMAKAIPDMLPHAKEWATILHYRMLNHAPSRQIYAKILSHVNLLVRNTIVSILKEIKAEDPDRFENSVDEILSSIKK